MIIVISMMACSKELNPDSIDGNVERKDSISVSAVKYEVIGESNLSCLDIVTKSTESLQKMTGDNCGILFSSAIGNMLADIEGYNTRANAVPLFYKSARVSYLTKDEKGEEVAASALIIYPKYGEMDKVMLINHGTRLGGLFVPTSYAAPEMLYAVTGALCVLPDYIGLGESSSHPDLYLNAKVHGTTSRDALDVVLQYAEDEGLNLDKEFSTYILGYSQGGAVSLATMKAISKGDNEKYRIKKVICGDGPYDLEATFEYYISEEEDGNPMGLGTVVPLVINSMFNSYPEEFSKYNYEDFFTEWALETGIPQDIRVNKGSLFNMLLKFNGERLSDILNMKLVTDDTPEFRLLLDCMKRQDLCSGPVDFPLQFIHCNPDGIVPYDNLESALQGMAGQELLLEPEVITLEHLSKPMLQHTYGSITMMAGVLSGKYY